MTPAELAARGLEIGLSAMALTDHDCTDGLAPFLAACQASEGRLEGIPGVEISCEIETGTMHMLGYYIDPAHEGLQGVLRKVRGGREVRNEMILERLNQLGMSLTWDEVKAYAGEDVVGRPHFAQAMIDKGYAKGKQEVFDKYLAKGQPGYVDRYRTTPEESINIIRAAGGVAVLAHPFTLGLNPTKLSACVRTLTDLGLGGIEVYYSEHNPGMVQQYTTLADACGLISTGGSDFHGDANPQIHMGVGFGGLKVADSVAARLRARWQEQKDG